MTQQMTLLMKCHLRQSRCARTFAGYTRFKERIIIEFFLNCQQHKVERSGNHFFPCFAYVKIAIVTDKFGRICYSNF